MPEKTARINMLQKLRGVKSTGRNKWQAICPSHQDKHPSLSVALTDEGTWLFKCWAGCEFHQIIGALGVEPQDLFPDKPIDNTCHGKPHYSPFNAVDGLRALSLEANVIYLAGLELETGNKLPEGDMRRLRLAVIRVGKVLSEVDK